MAVAGFPSTVVMFVRKRLIDKILGDLSRIPNMVSIDAHTFRVPIVGRVAAGRPIVADEEIVGYEYIDKKYSKDGHEYFGLRIVGKSMEPTIMDGDIVIVRRQNYVENGEIAIVLIDGEEATAKEVKESADGITLIGHNTAVYTPHFYSAQEVKNLPVQIIGRVVQSIRKF
ncbi:LexA family protein [Mitsuokella jalaludinii]|uniref:LexA family protein n=1 Tax=Mitsuokella jalaludinii TaxID=187979 RepID=UPI00242E1BF5|nr:S24 family peptidase [Mitsuokella jalaludinii]